MKKTILKAIFGTAAAFAAALAFSSAAVDARAAWGDYDTSFGFLGASIDPVTNHYPKHIALQSDGKIVVTGYRLVSGRKRLFVRRYLTNGQIDTAFGNNGAAVSNAILSATADYFGNYIAIQADGKIAVVGNANGKPAVWRFHANGYSDSSVGYGGIKILNGYAVPPSDGFKAKAQGNAVIIAVWQPDMQPQQLVLLRLGQNGRLDDTFGNGGEVATGFYGNPFDLNVEMPDGSISVGGPTADQIGISGIDRWTADGQADSGFVFAGTSTNASLPSNFVKLSNGKYAMPYHTIAWMNIPATARIFLFASNGPFEYSTGYDSGYSTETDCPRILAVQQDGRLLANGLTKLRRYDAELVGFQTNTCSNYGAIGSKTRAILQDDDKMIAAGRYNGYIALVRTLPN